MATECPDDLTLWTAWDFAGAAYDKLREAAAVSERDGDPEAAERIRAIIARYEAEADPLEYEILLSSGIAPKATPYERDLQFADLLDERFSEPNADASYLQIREPDADTAGKMQTLTELLERVGTLARGIDRTELSDDDDSGLDEVAESACLYSRVVRRIKERYWYSRHIDRGQVD